MGTVVSPLVLGLMAVYITGLLLLNRHQNGTRIVGWLSARAHDSLNRLLRVHPVSTRAWMGCPIQWARGLGQGYLVVDDVMHGLLAHPGGLSPVAVQGPQSPRPVPHQDDRGSAPGGAADSIRCLRYALYRDLVD